jgi:RNA polymerase sigma-70 factor, ECF subfamily
MKPMAVTGRGGELGIASAVSDVLRERLMDASPCFDERIEVDFGVGHTYYGDIGLPRDVYIAYVRAIVCKYLGSAPPDHTAIELVNKLYPRDLYLACGCVHESERAWQVLDTSYRKFIHDLVRFYYRIGTDSEEVADSVVISLFLPDRSGHPRIASYEGRSSLATWLRVIVVNRAINDRPNGKIASLPNTIADVADPSALARLELTLRADRYRYVLSDALRCAFRDVTPRERLMLLWRYEQGLPLGQIARVLGIHQSNVTRQLVRLQARLRENVVAILASKHELSASAIQECLVDVVENPQYTVSILRLIKEDLKLTSTTMATWGFLNEFIT